MPAPARTAGPRDGESEGRKYASRRAYGLDVYLRPSFSPSGDAQTCAASAFLHDLHELHGGAS
jgi:hypothetical protein